MRPQRRRGAENFYLKEIVAAKQPWCLAVLSLCLCVSVAAFQHPNFSGDFLLNLRASKLSPSVAAAAQGGMLHIDHSEPNFRQQMTIIFSGKPIETKYQLTTDGREVVSEAGGRKSASSIHWDGDALVNVTRIEMPNGGMTITFRFQLENNGRRVRASEQVRGGGRDQDNVWVFDR